MEQLSDTVEQLIGVTLGEMIVGVAIGIFIVLAIIVAIYVVGAVVLNNLNKQMYGKGTPMAWIPIVNIYLLGKLTVNKLFGWALIIVLFITGTYTTEVNGVSSVHTILPENINYVVSNSESLIIFILFIYAIIKLKKLKKKGATPIQQTNKEVPNQPVQPQPIVSEQKPIKKVEKNQTAAPLKDPKQVGVMNSAKDEFHKFKSN